MATAPASCKGSSENQSKVAKVSQLVQLCVAAQEDGFRKWEPVLSEAVRCKDHAQPLRSSRLLPDIHTEMRPFPTSALLMDPLHQHAYQKGGLSRNLPGEECL